METENQSTSDKKSSKKWWLLLIIVLAAGGVIAYFLTKDDANENTTPTQTTSQTQTTPTNSFAPASMADIPYVATVKTTAAGKSSTATMTSDGKGNVSYVYSLSGQEATLIYTDNAYYVCMGSASCIKYPKSQSSSANVDPSTYQYDQSKLNNLKTSAAYKGQQACPNGDGTCDVWSVTNNNVTSTMYINTTTKRIARVTTASGTTNSEVTYDYKKATVTIPTNYTTAPTQ